MRLRSDHVSPRVTHPTIRRSLESTVTLEMERPLRGSHGGLLSRFAGGSHPIPLPPQTFRASNPLGISGTKRRW